MASFISCYEDIAIQIARLHISDPPPIKPQQEQNKLLMGLTNIIEHTSIRGNTCIDMPSQDIYQFSNLYETIPLDFQIFVKVRFNNSKKQISVFATILKNGIPIRIQNRNQRIFINHFLLKTNGGMKYGSFKLNPLNGEITLSFNSFMTILQYESLLFEPSKCVQYIDQQLLKVKFLFRLHWYKIMHLVNYLPINYSDQPQLSHIKIRTMVANIPYKLNMLNKISPYLHLEFPFMNLEQGIGKGPRAEDVKKMNMKFQHTCLQSKQIHQEIIKFLKLLSPLKINMQIGQKFDQIEKKQFKNALGSPTIRYRQGQPCQIYSEIKVLSSKGWQIIDQGGFGIICKGFIEVTYPIIPGPPLRRLIVRKEDHLPNKQKLTHQKKILDRMKDKISPFIGKFFYSEQEQLKSYLFIQLCAHKSLANYRMRFKEVMSLQTKLTILKYLAQGLKFLKDQGICHLDIKPSNILFGSTHVKITDFGESYHRDVCPRGFRPGTSLPYAPPESFSPTEISYNDRLDVFSFGMVMFELIFDSYPLEYAKNKMQILRKSYMQKTYSRLFVVSPQKLSNNGYKCVIDYLGLLAMKCLDQRDNKRPCIEWIIVYLQVCINILSYVHF